MEQLTSKESENWFEKRGLKLQCLTEGRKITFGSTPVLSEGSKNWDSTEFLGRLPTGSSSLPLRPPGGGGGMILGEKSIPCSASIST